jgi:hypothetical protein
MTDPSRDAGTGDDSDRGSPPRMPRWVRIALLVAGVLVVVFVVLQLAGVGGGHGPGRHAPGGAAVPAGVVAPAAPALGDST